MPNQQPTQSTERKKAWNSHSREMWVTVNKTTMKQTNKQQSHECNQKQMQPT